MTEFNELELILKDENFSHNYCESILKSQKHVGLRFTFIFSLISFKVLAEK
jgi:hypothetical protein